MNCERLMFMSNDFQHHHAIEVPIQSRTSGGRILLNIIVFLLIIAGGILVALKAVKDREFFETYRIQIISGFAVLVLWLPLTGIVSPFFENSRLKRICTVRTTGTLVGYAEKYIRDYDQENSRSESYYEYAPKYEIYINGHYEIRTMNDFTRNKGCPKTRELLVNPDGYEIMSADGRMSRSQKASIKAGIGLLLIIAIIAVAVILFLL